MSNLLTGAVLSEMDADSLLSIDINAVELVSDFVPQPSGFYRFSVKETGLEKVGNEEKDAIKVAFTLTECVELAHPENKEDLEVSTESFADGKTVEHIEYFFLDGGKKKSAYGVRAFVTIFRGIVPEGQTANLQELLEMSVGTSGTALIEKTSYIPEGKTEEERKYNSRIKPTAVLFD